MVIRSISDQRHYARTNTAIQERSLCIISTPTETVSASRESRYVARRRVLERARRPLRSFSRTTLPSRSKAAKRAALDLEGIDRSFETSHYDSDLFYGGSGGRSEASITQIKRTNVETEESNPRHATASRATQKEMHGKRKRVIATHAALL